MGSRKGATEAEPASASSGRRVVGKQVVDAMAANSSNYKLERDAIFAASEALKAVEISNLPLKMVTTMGLSSLAAPAPNMASDAVAMNCFKGLRRSRKGGGSPKVSDARLEEKEGEGEGEKLTLRQRRMRKVESRMDFDEDCEADRLIENVLQRQHSKPSRRGKLGMEALQDVVTLGLARQMDQGFDDQDQRNIQNPCNTPKSPPVVAPAQLARQVSNAFQEEAAQMERRSVRSGTEFQVPESQNAALQNVGQMAGVKGPKSASLQQVSKAENRVSKTVRRARIELSAQNSAEQSILAAGAPLSARGTSKMVKSEHAGMETGNPGEVGTLRGFAKTKQSKRKVLSEKENMSPEVPEPSARMPKLGSPSRLSRHSPSENTVSEENNWVNFISDVIMWRHVPRSSLFFGMGCFFILSASFMQEMRCGVITIWAYSALLYLSAVFLHQNFLRREHLEHTEGPQMTEADVLDFIRFLMPTINLVVKKASQMFSGDPSTTLRMTVALWLLAQAGYVMSLWTLARLLFFALFILPKCYASYSTQLRTQAQSLISRLWLTWSCCSHKKLVLFATFLLAWNLSSLAARLCGAFILLVGLRLYHQSHNIFQQISEPSEMEIEQPSP